MAWLNYRRRQQELGKETPWSIFHLVSLGY